MRKRSPLSLRAGFVSDGSIELGSDADCAGCGGPAQELHHMIPFRNGGSDEPKNLIWLCRTCHQLVDRINLQDWSAALFSEAVIAFSKQNRGSRLFLLKALQLVSDALVISKAETNEGG